VPNNRKTLASNVEVPTDPLYARETRVSAPPIKPRGDLPSDLLTGVRRQQSAEGRKARAMSAFAAPLPLGVQNLGRMRNLAKATPSRTRKT
jgi:hypothetical protein